MIEFLKIIRMLLVVAAFLALAVYLVFLVTEHLVDPYGPGWLAIPIVFACIYASGAIIVTVYKLITGRDINDIM